MGPRPSLLPITRAMIVATLWSSKKSQREVAKQFKVSAGAVRHAVSKEPNDGGFCDAPRSGRPRKTNARDDRCIKRISEADRRKTAPAIRDELATNGGPRVSSATIKRRLKAVGLNGRIAIRKPY